MELTIVLFLAMMQKKALLCEVSMKRIPVLLDLNRLPDDIRMIAEGAPAFDSSCSKEARVVYLEKEGGLFLKSAPKGALEREAVMTRFFYNKGMAAEVLHYSSQEQDWLLTRRVPGEDCIHANYLADPKRLCDTTATLLRKLHEVDPAGCPVPDHTAGYLATAEQNNRAGLFDTHLFTPEWNFSGREEAWQHLQAHKHLLQTDTLLHGDYCLPNIILDDWRFSGFIDLDHGGIGDWHVDVFWGIWTLYFNFGTGAYRERFLDAYGRDVLQTELLRVIAAAECFG